MRLVKDADEIRRMRMAAEISAKGHLAAMRAAHPGAWEYELEGAAEGTFRSLGAERLAYPSIVGTGINATTLHYDKSRGQLQAGELVVMDMGGGIRLLRGGRDPDDSGQRASFTAAATGASTTWCWTPSRPRMDSVHPGMTLARLGQIAREYMKSPLRRSLRSRHLRPLLHSRPGPLARHGRARRRQLRHAAGPQHGLHRSSPASTSPRRSSASASRTTSW